MEVTGKVLREVEFRDRLRGYDTDEVDEFLEKVAVGVDALTARLEELDAQLAAQARQPQPQAPPPPASSADDDTIRRTLVLAQRTADLAISEARDEATRLLGEAREEAEALVGRAEENARRMRAEAEQELNARVARLGDERERLEREIRSLARIVEDERTRLTDSLSSALRFVQDTLNVSEEASRSVEASEAPRPAPEGGSSLFDAPVPPVPPVPPATTPTPASAAHDGAQAGDPPPARAERSERDGRDGRVDAGPEMRIPDVEREVDEDAASAAWNPRSEPGRGHVGTPRRMGPPEGPSGEGEAEEALWERWAAGRDLGVVPGPADFDRRAASPRGERDRGWSA